MAEEVADRVTLSAASARAVRLRAAAPRAAGAVAILLLALGGLRAIALPPRARQIVVRASAGTGADAAGRDAFAEVFARAYLTFDGADIPAHDRAVNAFLAPGTALEGSVQPASGQVQRVVWTAVAGHAPDPAGHHELVVVAVALDGQPALRYLAVPVASGDGGTLAVNAPPALVSPPPRDQRPAPAAGDEVSDDGLRTVAIRGLSAYLRASAGDLAADLTPGARTTVPGAPMALTDAQDVTWAGPDAVSVLATVRDGAGASYELVYRLMVEHRDRWFISAIDPTTNPKGAST